MANSMTIFPSDVFLASQSVGRPVADLSSAATVPGKSSQVAALLRAHPFLQKLLPEACQAITKHFGPGFELALEIYTDPEDGSRELLLLIRTDKPAAEVLPILDRFDEEWWIDNFERAEGLLTIKLEYV